MPQQLALSGAGLGLRREWLADLLPRLAQADCGSLRFVEIAPENWANMGGRFARDLGAVAEHLPLVLHGLSLSLGGSDALDMRLLRDTKALMQQYGIGLYTEHLSWCAHEGQLYDLLPLPCTDEAVRHVAARIRIAQDFLGQRIGIENASYYQAPAGANMSEAAFISAVVQEADCLLHLDVNNVYVNSINHGFDATDYLQQLPLHKVCYLHVAGHDVLPDGLLLDTHGAAVIDPVWQLLRSTYAALAQHGIAPQMLPTCLERDTQFPPLQMLLAEVAQIADIQKQMQAPCAVREQQGESA